MQRVSHVQWERMNGRKQKWSCLLFQSLSLCVGILYDVNFLHYVICWLLLWLATRSFRVPYFHNHSWIFSPTFLLETVWQCVYFVPITSSESSLTKLPHERIESLKPILQVSWIIQIGKVESCNLIAIVRVWEEWGNEWSKKTLHTILQVSYEWMSMSNPWS